MAVRRWGRRCVRCAREARRRDRLRPERARSGDHDGARGLGGHRPRGGGDGRRRRALRRADAPGVRARRLLGDPPARARLAVLPRPRAAGRVDPARRPRPLTRSTTARRRSRSARFSRRRSDSARTGPHTLRLFHPVVDELAPARAVDPRPASAPAARAPRQACRIARNGLSSARSLADRFRTREARALLAGHAAHSMLPLDKRPSGGVGLFLGRHGPRLRLGLPAWRVAADRRRTRRPTTRARRRDPHGQPRRRAPESRRGPRRRRAARAPAHRGRPSADALRARAAPVSLRPGRLQARLGARRADPVGRRGVPSGRDRPPRRNASRSSPTRSERPWEGRHPDRPFVLLAQQSLFDDSRAPAGKHTAWAYCHVPNGSTRGHDRPDRGSGRALRARLPRPRPRQSGNRAGRTSSAATRTSSAATSTAACWTSASSSSGRSGRSSRTARLSNGLYLCSSATPPGGGVHGMCGYSAALVALRDHDGSRSHT